MENKQVDIKKEYYNADIGLLNNLKKANKLIKEIKLLLENFSCELDIYVIQNKIDCYLDELKEDRILNAFNEYIN